jgi:hypothetical protein
VLEAPHFVDQFEDHADAIQINPTMGAEVFDAADGVNRFVIESEGANVWILLGADEAGFAVEEDTAAGNAGEVDHCLETVKNSRLGIVNFDLNTTLIHVTPICAG